MTRTDRISIHALREEGDPLPQWRCSALWSFLSTPSARRATASVTKDDADPKISIHALREEGDYKPMRFIIKT